ncbi:MAG: hypothetical protein GY820_45480 [Gammaproteobacteria bacterium]|nr:hypothetical protein [Gammaproteobacteria bacterium]
MSTTPFGHRSTYLAENDLHNTVNVEYRGLFSQNGHHFISFNLHLIEAESNALSHSSGNFGAT